ncbi:MAG: agmatine deiminase family protein, partial [Gammaproteobacteria bacterium]
MNTSTPTQAKSSQATPGLEGTRALPSTPRRLPAEWEPQDALMLAWPHRANGWKGDMAAVDTVFVELIHAAAQYQRVLLVCTDEALRDHAIALLQQAGVNMQNCLPRLAATNDVWMRDAGPIGVIEGGKHKLLDFRFNAWGGKYSSSDDDQINRRLAEQDVFACELQSIPLILEGGSIESNGKGSLLTTQSCLLTTTRNACYDQGRIEDLLKQFLGVDNVHWISHGHIEGDDTDGHVDTLARFCPNDVIAYASCTDPDDVNYAELAAMEKELQALRQPNGDAYGLVAFTLPAPKFGLSGQRLACTYVNFMIINGAILCPLYDDPMDKVAITQLQTLFPQYEIIGINALPVVEQCGSFHCLCMQLTQGTMK